MAAAALSIGLIVVWMAVCPASSRAALTIIPSGEPGGFLAETTETQAGAHPDAFTDMNFAPQPVGIVGGGVLKDAIADVPVGLSGNPQAAPHCPVQDLVPVGGSGQPNSACPPESQIGVVELRVGVEPGVTFVYATLPLYNVTPPPGAAADFAFMVPSTGLPVHILATTRPEDNGIRLTTRNVSQFFSVSGVRVTVWGVPADSSHDALRKPCLDDGGFPNGQLCPAANPRRPFISNPTACDGPKLTTMSIRAWAEQGVFHSATASAPTPTGCNQLDFSPTIEARPTTDLADSPSGLDFNLHIPQNEDPDGLAEAHLKDTTVTLPQGLTVNPSSANGLGACDPAQIGLTTPIGQKAAHFDASPAECPDASKLGTVEIQTPLLDHPLSGAVYLAAQDRNPFASLLAIYLAVDDHKSGIVLKLAGKVSADPVSGQLTARFEENPQLPFEDLHVNFFEGSRAALRTPVSCGTFTTTSDMTPWSSPEGADAFPSSAFEITHGAGGGACASSDDQAPNNPSFNAGTVDPTAGAFTPFVLELARADGTQPIKGIETTLPKGLLGKLAGIPYCSDAVLAAAAAKTGKAEQASPSCPSASEVGSVNVGAGAGPAPLHVDGKAYLAGPYKGAPLSLAIITPAVAGPFDLGVVVVRTALQVDPTSAQIHAVSDPIPTLLQGIPLDVRSISLNMARPKFTLNPTSCDPMAITGSALSVFDQSAPLSSPFQVGDCGRLAFKPELAIKLKGATKRSQYPALRATLKARPGDANIARTTVALPHSEFLAQSHIKTICTRVQFAADACPAGSVYGSARAFSPLLDQPLEGPVYLRSSANPLPDLVVALSGQIDVDLVGRIDSVKGGIRTSFESVPDAPVSKFVLSMKGGKKGLLENSRNLCRSTNKATVAMDAQNGKVRDFTPVVQNSCKKARKHKRSGKPDKG